MSPHSPPADLSFLTGGGKMATLIKEYDWAKSPVGAPRSWSPSLRATLGMILPAQAEIVLFWGPDFVAFYNDAYAPTIGNKHPRALGRPARENWSELWGDLEPLLRGVLKTGQTFSAKDRPFYIERHGVGETVYFDVSYSAVRETEGTVCGVLCIVSETTARVRAETELRANETQFRSFAQAIPNHFWTSTPNGELDWFNDQVYAYSGLQPGELDGDGWAAIVHPEDLPYALRNWQEALSSGEIYEAEFRLKRHDGVWRWHIARAVPIRDTAGHIIRWVGTNTDIQDQKEVSAALTDINAALESRVNERTMQLRDAEEKLRQAHKMEAVGQLTGGLAHDFNNLLQGITGALDRIQSRIANGRLNDVDRFLKAATDSANRAAALTHRLLAFSRRQTLDPTPADVNQLISGLEDLIRQTMGPAVEVAVSCAHDLWSTKIDVPQLESALLNLCINARDAMPDGGKLSIETANQSLDEQAALEREVLPGHYVSVSVADNGTGMTPEVIARAFDPFFTTKPLGRGTGLGLSMIYGFVRQSGGQVRIYSDVGHGTAVRLYLPRYFGALKKDSPPSDGQMNRGLGETVLVVDDDPIVRMLVSEVLAENSYNILEATNGPSALKLIDSSRRIDLLITDVGLPGGMNGRQVADAARVRRPDLKVLFITGYAENTAIKNGHLGAGMAVLAKPFAMATLGNKIRGMLEA
jgi:PAS domain S-box-containing protein